jgi:hypothetical protein
VSGIILQVCFKNSDRSLFPSTVAFTPNSFHYFSTLFLQSLPRVKLQLVKNEFYGELIGLIEKRHILHTFDNEMHIQNILILLSNAGGTLL